LNEKKKNRGHGKNMDLERIFENNRNIPEAYAYGLIP